MEWLSHNAGTVITVVVVLLGVVGTWVVYGADIKQLKQDRDEMEKLTRGHVSDSTLHIDPHRDEKRWDDFKQEIFHRFDSMDRKIDRLMIQAPPPKNNG